MAQRWLGLIPRMFAFENWLGLILLNDVGVGSLPRTSVRWRCEPIDLAYHRQAFTPHFRAPVPGGPWVKLTAWPMPCCPSGAGLAVLEAASEGRGAPDDQA